RRRLAPACPPGSNTEANLDPAMRPGSKTETTPRSRMPSWFKNRDDASIPHPLLGQKSKRRLDPASPPGSKSRSPPRSRPPTSFNDPDRASIPPSPLVQKSRRRLDPACPPGSKSRSTPRSRMPSWFKNRDPRSVSAPLRGERTNRYLDPRPPQACNTDPTPRSANPTFARNPAPPNTNARTTTPSRVSHHPIPVKQIESHGTKASSSSARRQRKPASNLRRSVAEIPLVHRASRSISARSSSGRQAWAGVAHITGHGSSPADPVGRRRGAAGRGAVTYTGHRDGRRKEDPGGRPRAAQRRATPHRRASVRQHLHREHRTNRGRLGRGGGAPRRPVGTPRSRGSRFR